MVAEFQAWDANKKRVREYHATPAAREAKKKRDVTPAAREAKKKYDRDYRATPGALEAHRTRNAAAATKHAEAKQKARLQYARANREEGATGSSRPGLPRQLGTWQEAAHKIAEAEGHESLATMPPSFVALNDHRCIRCIGQMYSFFDEMRWSTCVVCWRAWYNPNLRFAFDRTSSKLGDSYRSWFNPYSSVVLGLHRKHTDHWAMHTDRGRHEQAVLYLENHNPSSLAASIEARLTDVAWRRDVIICTTCIQEVDLETGKLKPPVGPRMCDYNVDPVTAQSALDGTASPDAYGQYERWQDHQQEQVIQEDPRAYVLGQSVEEFACAVAALSDSEEMVLALVHPLLQVYTIPKTGQLAYVGHICNFRQKVSKFVATLPTMPQDMPFVQIRPRSMGNRPTFRAPFKVDVRKLRHA